MLAHGASYSFVDNRLLSTSPRPALLPRLPQKHRSHLPSPQEGFTAAPSAGMWVVWGR